MKTVTMNDIQIEPLGLTQPRVKGKILIQILLTWHRRSVMRHQLKNLTDHLLKDTGLSRSDLEHEMNKPFWKA